MPEASYDLFDLTEANTHNDMLLARRVAEHLENHYPGWSWACSIDRGVVNVVSMRLSGVWGFTVKIEDIRGDMRNITMAGGEVLERFNAYRGRCTFDRFLAVKDTQPNTDGLPNGRKR